MYASAIRAFTRNITPLTATDVCMFTNAAALAQTYYSDNFPLGKNYTRSSYPVYPECTANVVTGLGSGLLLFTRTIEGHTYTVNVNANRKYC